MAIDNREQLATRIYFDRSFNCDSAKILPGEYDYTNKEMMIVTVLGFCVCLYS